MQKSEDSLKACFKNVNINPCHAEYFMYYTPLQFLSFNCSIPVINMSLQAEWKTVWILIRWLHEKPADLNLQCFQKRINPGTS